MALTDVKCRSAKPGKTRVKLSDGGGLQFWVQPSGSRLWQLVYQYQGKQAQMAKSLVNGLNRSSMMANYARAGLTLRGNTP